MNWSLYTSFLGVAILVLLAPGPSLAYSIAVASKATRREAMLNAVGMGIGGLVIVVALALGAAHLLQALPAAYIALKLAGCIYLIALGIHTLREASLGQEPGADKTPPAGFSGPLLQGLLVETANPKAILFYAALIPQFVDRSLGHVQGQLLVLGITFVIIQVAWDATLMLGLQRYGRRFNSVLSVAGKVWMRKISGCTFIAVGLALLQQDAALGVASES